MNNQANLVFVQQISQQIILIISNTVNVINKEYENYKLLYISYLSYINKKTKKKYVSELASNI